MSVPFTIASGFSSHFINSPSFHVIPDARRASEYWNFAFSQARAADITLSITGGTLSPTICDDGIGIPPEHQRNPGGLGLVSIRERARLVNGRVDISGQPSNGTTIKILDPIIGKGL
jgi:signal transduction histidine kinase